MTTITVSSLTELYDALAAATGGETIALAPGNYGKMSLTGKSGFDLTFPSNVTITSADPENPAVFTGLDIRDASNLTFDSLVFDYTFSAGDKIYVRPFSVSGGENIAITNSTFDGDVAQGVSAVDDGYGYAIGLSVRGSTGVTLEGNEIYGFHRGLTVSESDRIAVIGNELHSIRMDGMNFAEVTDVLIEGNYIHDFSGSPNSGDHCDMIQFWTNGTDAPSTDIIIRGNVLDIGNGTTTQSIFMRNEEVDQGRAGSEMFYQNVLIEENVITNAHQHGITVGETDGLVIRQNSVLHADGGNQDGLDDSVEIPRISVASGSTNVTVTGNATSNIAGLTDQTDWVVKQNAIVQDQNMLAPGYYGDVFVSSSLTAKDGLHQFVALPGGMVDMLGAGAAATLEAPPTGTVTSAFQVGTDPDGSVQTRSFDASLSHLDSGSLPPGTIYEWSFGDGTTAQGLTTTHTYADGGTYDVTLTVILPDGTSHPETASVAVQDSLVLSLGADGAFHAQQFGEEIVLPPGPTVTDDGIQLGAKGVAVSVAREHVTDILGTTDFDISLEIQADVAGTKGEIFRLHESIIVEVNSKGELYVRAYGSEGEQIKLTTTGVVVNDLKEHDIGISLEDGLFSVTVDGRVAAQTAFDGTLASTGNHSLTFGNPWNGTNFNGDLSSFEISVGDTAPPAMAESQPAATMQTFYEAPVSSWSDGSLL